ncbi:MAG: conjugal transfer protein, partial [Nitrospinae bacterium]|nr:conjugal transfer protein [Nitrospinota bacterium]
MKHRFIFIPIIFSFVLWTGEASAQSCTGRFVNPVADVCWECLFPISIGPIRIGSAVGAPDTPNPGSPICFCGSPIPRIGLSLGVWEPARLIDASRAPWCFPNLGGLTIDGGLPAGRGRTGTSGGDGAQGSTWHVHYYVYPLLSWIGALLDLGCLEGGGLDIAWVSELDPAWRDDELSFLLNPEAALFADLPAQAACAADCAAASAGLPLDPLYWCAGCQGSMYPLTGN